MTPRRLSLLAAAGTFAASAAFAQAPQAQQAPRTIPTAGSVAITPFFGTDFTVGGTATKGGSQSAVAAGSFRFGASTITFNAVGTASIGSKKFTDVYNMPHVIGIGGSYGVTDGGEVFGSFRYLRASAKVTSGITYNVSGNVNGTAFAAGATSTMKASDFSAFSLDAGYRHFFRMGGGFTPYLGGYGGFMRTGPIDVTETLVGVNGTARLYDEAFAPALGLQLGVTYTFIPNGSIGLETGLRYDFRMKGQDRDLAAGFQSVNDAGDRWSIPVTIKGRIAF